MDRIIQQPGQIPLVEQALAQQRMAMVSAAALAQAILGTGTLVDGLACTPVAGALSVSIGPGTIFSQQVLDQNPFGVLPADTAHAIVKYGVNLDAVPFVLAAPATAGQSVNILIEACFLETDGNALELPFYNSANPGQPFSGPGGGGATVNTTRTARVQMQAKAGVAAAAGTQLTPAVDAGWVPLYVITLGAGATSVLPANIAVAPGAPFITVKLPQMATATGKSQGFIDARVDHGAKGDGVTDDTLALEAALLDMATSGKPLFIPAGHYICNSALNVDVAPCSKTGFRIFGAGGQNTLIDFLGVPAGQGTPLAFLCSTGATGGAFYGRMYDVAIKGNYAGPLVRVGQDSFVDAFNNYTADGLIINNLSTDPATAGVRLNYLITCNFTDCSVNCAGVGDAVQCRQVQRSKIDGALGTATNAVHFFDGYNFSVQVEIDAENIQRVIKSSNPQTTKISFEEGQWVPLATDGAIDAPYAANFWVGSSVNLGNGGPWTTPATVGVFVQNTGVGVITTGGETIAPVTGDAVVSLQAPTGFSAFWKMLTGTVMRWQWGKNQAAETGGNAGSDLILSRFDDTGHVIDNPISVNRASGRTTVTALQATLFGVGSATPVGPYNFVGSRSGTPTAAQFAQIYTALAACGIGTDSTTA